MSSSDKENDSRPSSSLHGNISKSDAHRMGSGDSFQYRTINGGVIRSVVAPGKGIKVDYKVSSFSCRFLILHAALCVLVLLSIPELFG